MESPPSGWKAVLESPAAAAAYEKRVKSADETIRAFLEFDPLRATAGDPPAAISAAGAVGGAARGTGPLAGLPFAVKDNIAVQGFRLTCGSALLVDLDCPYTATAVRRLEAAGARVVGKTNLDEFGMGSSTEHSAFGLTRNPWNTELVAGGSSGGSAAAVAAGMVPFALGSDTGGSVRQPAAFCGVYGLKPTYGVVSRYGLTAYASSLEVIGLCSADIDTAQAAFETMRGQDELDQSSVKAVPERSTARSVGVLEGDLGLHPHVAAGYEQARGRLRKLGYEIAPVELPTLEYCVAAYYTIATAEASANLARFTGIRYGRRPDYAENPEDLVRRARSEGFGREVKLRILLGTYVLRSGFQDQYYLRAQKVRTAIREDFARLFASVDLLLLPVFPVQPFRPGDAVMDAFQQKMADRFTTAANLTGLPALSFPAALAGGLPVGLQLMAPAFCEERLFEAARAYAGEFPPPAAPGREPAWR